MVTVSGFDTAASGYDKSFTHTEVGKMQRQRVYSYLEPYLGNSNTLDILELNCGTGEDALFMAKNGHRILATDLSPEMLSTARGKSEGISNIQFQLLNINDLDQLDASDKYDIIFSNFGGLNCIAPDQFQDFFSNARTKLKKGGKIILVIMSKSCLWEQFFYLAKGNRAKAYRRNSDKGLPVVVGESEVMTWYYNPNNILGYADNAFKKILLRPIGILIPPSYLNAFFKRNKRLLKALSWLENTICNFGFLSPYADHYLIIFKLK